MLAWNNNGLKNDDDDTEFLQFEKSKMFHNIFWVFFAQTLARCGRTSRNFRVVDEIIRRQIWVSGASKRSHSIARDSKLFKEIVELMSKTYKMGNIKCDI